MKDLELKGKTVLISGADSGIGKATAILLAKEGADIAIIYYKDTKDAEKTRQEIKQLGRRCVIFGGDVSDLKFCENTAKKTVAEFGKIDILINNAGTQFPCDKIRPLQLLIRVTKNCWIIQPPKALLFLSQGLSHCSQNQKVSGSTPLRRVRWQHHLPRKLLGKERKILTSHLLNAMLLPKRSHQVFSF